MPSSSSSTPNRPATMQEMDDRNTSAWMVSFSAAMVPFCGFLYGHSRGMTVRAIEAVVRSPVGVYGLLALPFCTLGMEKCIYDTVQAAQGIDPRVRPADRGGFPSGGADFPSFSLIPVQAKSLLPEPMSLFSKECVADETMSLARKLTTKTEQ